MSSVDRVKQHQFTHVRAKSALETLMRLTQIASKTRTGWSIYVWGLSGGAWPLRFIERGAPAALQLLNSNGRFRQLLTLSVVTASFLLKSIPNLLLTPTF
jgi:hypothetical protein